MKLVFFLTGFFYTFQLQAQGIQIPTLVVNHESTHPITRAYRIAMGDVAGNIQYHQSGVLEEKKACLYAGLLYDKPWTRDAAINVWNGIGLLAPEVAKNTLLAQVEKIGQEEQIGGQYWDKIIWTLGAWAYYQFTGDRAFLERSYRISLNTIRFMEKTEFSTELGLFRGAAVYGDGVAAYPEIYTRHMDSSKTGSYSGILDWLDANPDLKNSKGGGLPMHALSTNAVYYQAYLTLAKMEHELGLPVQEYWSSNLTILKKAIHREFWNAKKGSFNYLVDPFGGSDAQEALGLSFVLLFGLTQNDKQVSQLFENTIVTPAGIPCVYPSFPRYRIDSVDGYGRHCGTVWPHAQGFWADAAMKYGRDDVFMHEFEALTRHAIRDVQFYEIYHPTKETFYGGLQEPHQSMEWFCAERQTWSATAYLNMLFKNIVGLHFSSESLVFQPFLPASIKDLQLNGLVYRDMELDIYIQGQGKEIASFKVNGKESSTQQISSQLKGKVQIEISMR